MSHIKYYTNYIWMNSSNNFVQGLLKGKECWKLNKSNMRIRLLRSTSTWRGLNNRKAKGLNSHENLNRAKNEWMYQSLFYIECHQSNPLNLSTSHALRTAAKLRWSILKSQWKDRTLLAVWRIYRISPHRSQWAQSYLINSWVFKVFVHLYRCAEKDKEETAFQMWDRRSRDIEGLWLRCLLI